jgi:hypothetical protein
MFRRNAAREQHGNAASHERGLAGSGACFHEQGAVDCGQGGRSSRKIGDDGQFLGH